jgi:hypothetical protein
MDSKTEVVTPDASKPDNDHSKARAARLSRPTLVGILAALFLQFILGIYLNLCVPHLHSQPVLVMHIALGSALVLGGLALITLAIMSGQRDHILVASGGLLALVIAWGGGYSFRTGGGQAADSFTMAIGFGCAVAVFVAGLLVLRQAHPPAWEHKQAR